VTNRVAIRPARDADAGALTAIYAHYVLRTHVTFDGEPPTVEGRKAWLADHQADPRHLVLVAELDEAVVGWAASGRYRPRSGYDTTVETSAYLHPDHAGRGLGRALYEELFRALRGWDVHRAVAGIALPNPASVALHERLGFREVGRFSEHGRKFGRYWDVAWYRSRWGNARRGPARFRPEPRAERGLARSGQIGQNAAHDEPVLLWRLVFRGAKPGVATCCQRSTDRNPGPNPRGSSVPGARPAENREVAMVVVMRSDAREEDILRVVMRVQDASGEAYVVHGKFRTIIGLVGDTAAFLSLPLSTLPGVDHVVQVGKPYKLVARELHPALTTVHIGNAEVGRAGVAIIAGPCAVENRDQALASARAARDAGATLLRGGAYKPRTSPYAFQGLARDGLAILAECREETGLPVVTEVMEARDVEHVAEVADALQIGTRNMQNFSLLKEVGRAHRPVLLKRGLSATVEEWIMAAEHIAQQGNSDIVLCERGIRTFEPSTRNTLDLAGMAVAQQETHLPVIVDPSHATGRRDLVPAMARAALAAGADGIMVDVHPTPSEALCDGPQALTPDELVGLVAELSALARALGRAVAPRPGRDDEPRRVAPAAVAVS